MASFIAVAAANALTGSLLAIGVILLVLAVRNPFLQRGMWLAVLLKFIVPPLLLLPLVNVAIAPSDEPTIEPTTFIDTLDAADDAIDAYDDAPATSQTITPHLAEASVRSPLAETTAPLPVTQSPTPQSPPALAASEIAAPRTIHIAPSAQSATRSLVPWLATIWLVGAAGLAAVALFRVARFHAALRRAERAPERLQRRAQELAAQAGLAVAPNVCVIESRTPPLVWRLGRTATILLPASLVQRLPAAQLDAILAHEVTHLRRRDVLVRWLEFAVVVAFWWCPTAWFVRRRLHDAEELCCDADALAAFPHIAAHYAKALLAALEFAAPAPRLAFVAAPFLHRGSLIRRFEMLTGPRRYVRPSRAVVAAFALAAAALLATTPVAFSADAESDSSIKPAATEPALDAQTDVADPTQASPHEDLNDAASADVPDAKDLARPSPPVTDDALQSVPTSPTFTMLVGSYPNQRTVTGRWISATAEGAVFESTDGDQYRMTLLPRERRNPPKSGARDDASPESDWTPKGERVLRRLTLDECCELALKHHQDIRFEIVANVRTVSPKPTKPMPPDDFQQLVANRLRDVEDAYWELWFAYQDLNAAKAGRDQILEVWQRVKTLQRAGAVGGEDNAEAQARSVYYELRARVETSLTNLYRVENRMRYLIGISPADGYLMEPAGKPDSARTHWDWEKLQKEVLDRRPELTRQRRAIAAAEAALTAANSDASLSPTQRQGANLRAQRRLDRERAILADMQIEIAHELVDAVRDEQMNFGLLEANANRSAASDDQVNAVSELKVGQIQLDRVLDAHARQIEAHAASARSQADHARAVARLQYRKASFIADHNFQIASITAD